MRRLRGYRLVCWCLLGVLLAGRGAAIGATTFEEYDVKAALLFKLAKFTEWPPEAFAREPENFTICVLGRSPMGPALERAVAGKSMGGHGVIVRRVVKVEQLADCHIVFNGGPEAPEHERMAEEVAGRPVLLVGEAPCFAHCSGMVNFFVENARLRFEIHPEHVERAGLSIDPNVLRLARLVGPDKECDCDALHP